MLMLIEMLFDNLIGDLTPPELAAVLSVIIYNKENKTNYIINRRLGEIAEKIKIIAENLCDVELKCGLEIDKEYMMKERTKFGFMEIAYNWCRGMSFNDVIQKSQGEIDEGDCVSMLQRTALLCTKLGAIGREIGNADICHKCDEVCQLLLRDVVFTPSLYFDE